MIKLNIDKKISFAWVLVLLSASIFFIRHTINEEIIQFSADIIPKIMAIIVIVREILCEPLGKAKLKKLSSIENKIIPSKSFQLNL